MDNGLCLLYICVVSKLLTRKTQKPGRGERKNTRHGRGTDDGKKHRRAVDNRVMRSYILYIGRVWRSVSHVFRSVFKYQKNRQQYVLNALSRAAMRHDPCQCSRRARSQQATTVHAAPS